MKILVPVDGSPFTKRMLAYLAAHDEWLGDHQQYTLLHVAPAVPSRAASVIDKSVLRGYYAEESETIADMATKGKFDLVMMGSHGHGSLTSLVMGSVTNKVMAHCATPVLIVR